ncbi:MAG: dihydroorotase [Acidimicrobiaceae bacterium]
MADVADVLLLKGGRVVDLTGTRVADVAVAGGRVVAVGPDLETPAGARVLDAGGCVVAPGLVDLHAHLRQPGREEAETVETGARAAALGGYTAVVAMPNTEPAIDTAAAVREVLELGVGALCQVRVAGAITCGRRGEVLAPMAEMADLGVRLFTDDGTGVQDGRLMRRALEYSSDLGVTLAQHCEDAVLAAGGHMHEGEWSSRLGIPGMAAAAEEVMVLRDLTLLRLTAGMGARVHFQHLSTAASLAAVRAAKAAGLAVSAEAAPHHFTLTDASVASYDPVFKVNPPLRPQADVDAVKAALADGTLDAIATDHAPHAPEDKELPFDQAPPGMLGLETALALALGELDLPIEAVLALLSWQPARIAGLDAAHGGPVAEGRPANLCVIDPAATWEVDAAHLASRSRNTPYHGRKLTGRVRHTVLFGEPVVIDAEAQR